MHVRQVSTDMIYRQVILAALRLHPVLGVSRAHLASTAGCSERDVRNAIAGLRRQGWLIVCQGDCYHFARTIEEVHQLVTNFERQIRSLEGTRAALLKAARQRFGEDAPLSVATSYSIFSPREKGDGQDR